MSVTNKFKKNTCQILNFELKKQTSLTVARSCISTCVYFYLAIKLKCFITIGHLYNTYIIKLLYAIGHWKLQGSAVTVCENYCIKDIIIMAEFHTPVRQNKVVEDKITIPPSPFLHRLGYGTGVSVMQLVRSPRAGQFRSPWALKMLNKRVKANRVYSERLKVEAELLQRMSHPNIVGFRAFSKTKTLFLGMEACDLSLGDLIEKREQDGNEPFHPRQILKVATDIAKALDYLHTKMQLLHGDMKSYNILVNGDFEICKLCDFGVTLPLDENGVFDKEKAANAVYYGTEAWSAPEVIHGGEISSKTDIWPYGLTLWEMMALMAPHTQLEESMEDSVVSLDNSVVCLDDSEELDEDYFSKRYGTRPPIPANISETEYGHPLALFFCCTEMDACNRPSAQQLAAAAEDILLQYDKHL